MGLPLIRRRSARSPPNGSEGTPSLTILFLLLFFYFFNLRRTLGDLTSHNSKSSASWVSHDLSEGAQRRVGGKSRGTSVALDWLRSLVAPTVVHLKVKQRTDDGHRLLYDPSHIQCRSRPRRC